MLVVQLEVPFLVILGRSILRERPGRKKILGIAFAFGGVALIAGEPKLAGQMVPILMVLGGAFSWGIGQIMVRSLGPVGGFTLIAWVSVFAAPQLFIASFIFEHDQIRLIQEANWIVWGTVVYMGLIMTALGYAIWYHLLGKYPVNRAAPFLLLLPVFTILGGVLLLGESLTLQTALGGAVVIAGVGRHHGAAVKAVGARGGQGRLSAKVYSPRAEWKDVPVAIDRQIQVQGLGPREPADLHVCSSSLMRGPGPCQSVTRKRWSRRSPRGPFPFVEDHEGRERRGRHRQFLVELAHQGILHALPGSQWPPKSHLSG